MQIFILSTWLSHLSIGIGVYPDDGRTPAELIKAADQRLYHRKKSHNQRALSAS